ncbi:MAG UNVERIFIED_CONTAM: ribosome silencing factor [Planctomycetaceae bacterium]|jgi:ribosome silencing factor RsfS/YbeB/iojap
MASPAPTLAALSATPVAAVPRSLQLYQSSLSNAVTAARIADLLRGQNIVVLDLTGVTSIVDFFVIVTGSSSRQMHAIADEVNRKLKHEDGNRRISIEGYRTEGNWILIDFGDVVLHVFTPKVVPCTTSNNSGATLLGSTGRWRSNRYWRLRNSQSENSVPLPILQKIYCTDVGFFRAVRSSALRTKHQRRPVAAIDDAEVFFCQSW